MSETESDHVVLKHKDSSVGHFAPPIPQGLSAADVVEAWKPYGWVRGAKTELDELLDNPTVPENQPAEPVTTTKH